MTYPIQLIERVGDTNDAPWQVASLQRRRRKEGGVAVKICRCSAMGARQTEGRSGVLVGVTIGTLRPWR